MRSVGRCCSALPNGGVGLQVGAENPDGAGVRLPGVRATERVFAVCLLLPSVNENFKMQQTF